MSPGTLTSSAALVAFAEPFVESRRVLVFGSSLSTSARLLLERGARIVHVCDPAPLRVAEAAERLAAPGLSFSTFADELLAAREGAFDCVLVENLAAFDSRTVVARARRLLAPRGVAVFATPNREVVAPLLPPPEPGAAPLDYYAFYDVVATEFEVVRMFGQAPFVGYAVVDFTPDGAPEPQIDSEFLPRGSEEPELFVAVAARHHLDIAGYALVQLPLHRVLSAGGAGASRPSTDTADLARKVAQQESWIAEVEARAETADARADQAEEELEIAHKERDEAREALERSRFERRAAPAPNDDAKHELEANAARARELAERLADREVLLRERDAALAAHEATIREQAAALSNRDAKLAELSGMAAADATGDLDALEQKLVDRGAELRRLERELAESERIGRELVRELGARGAAGDSETLRQLDELSERLAVSEADRAALAWAATLPRGPTDAPG